MLSRVSRVRLSVIPWTVGPPSRSVCGFLQARILVGVAISFSRGSPHPRDRNQVSPHCGQIVYCVRVYDAFKVLQLQGNQKTGKVSV